MLAVAPSCFPACSQKGRSHMFAPKVAKPQTRAAEKPVRKLALQPSMLVARPFGGAVEHAHMLQRTIGNQATLRYLTQRLSKPPEKAPDQHRLLEARTVTAGATQGVSWNFSQIPLFPPDQANRLEEPFPFEAPRLPIAIQPKLIVGQANDPLEYEADRVADQVMGMPDPGVSI
jgi:hypothetical protein